MEREVHDLSGELVRLEIEAAALASMIDAERRALEPAAALDGQGESQCAQRACLAWAGHAGYGYAVRQADRSESGAVVDSRYPVSA